jgi:hypothetical protein
MPIDVQVFMGANDTTFVIFDSNRKQSFILDLPAEADSVKIDPNDWILCTKGEVPFSMAIATDPVDTAQLGVAYYLALEAVGGTPPYAWQKLSGQYPYGTTLYQGDSAYLAGVPNYAAAFHFQMRVYDSSIPPVADTLWFHITVVDQQQYLCGDANADSKVNVADAIYIINYVFVPGSPAPHPSAAGDPNCDTRVNITDAVYLINRVFIPGSPAPCDPDGNGVPDC